MAYAKAMILAHFWSRHEQHTTKCKQQEAFIEKKTFLQRRDEVLVLELVENVRMLAAV